MVVFTLIVIATCLIKLEHISCMIVFNDQCYDFILMILTVIKQANTSVFKDGLTVSTMGIRSLRIRIQEKNSITGK